MWAGFTVCGVDEVAYLLAACFPLGPDLTKKLSQHPLIRLDQQLKQLAEEHDRAERKTDRR